MVYIPTFTIKNEPNVGKYTIHGSSGYVFVFICQGRMLLSCSRSVATCRDLRFRA